MVCGDGTSTEAAHIRYRDPEVAKDEAGMGRKPDDIYVVPLCGKCHRSQHDFGDERTWWKAHYKDPVKKALAFWANTGDHETCERIAAF
jgi:hypothetical protein